MQQATEVSGVLRDSAQKCQAVTAVVTAFGGDAPTLEELKHIYARAVLRALGGNKSAAARQLGITRRSLYRLLALEAG